MNFKKILVFIFFLCLSFSLTDFLLTRNGPQEKPVTKPVVIGFLPYWLLNKATKDYSQYFTKLSYFSLTIASDGTIKKLNNPRELEPGWNALNTLDLKNATELTVFASSFSKDMDAASLAAQLKPIMTDHGFTALNLDIEDVSPASPAAQFEFSSFVKNLKQNIVCPLSLDVSPTDLIKPRLINVSQIAPYVDNIILMTYDYHYSGSLVTGPVAPVGGFGKTAEYDVETAIKIALNTLPKEKIILGVPLYGYEWETLSPDARAAVLPGSGQVASNQRVATISAIFDPDAQENHAVYFDDTTQTYHQIFFPTDQSVQAKINLAKKYELGGLAFWAVGYDGPTILKPLAAYR